MTHDAREPARSAIDALLAEAGIEGDYRLSPVAGGRNNRVYCVWRPSAAQAPAAVLKWYFSHPLDRRDRLAAETLFLLYAEHRGILQAPRLLAADREARLALIEYLPGRQLSAGEVGAEHVRAAAEFFRLLNEHRRDEAGAGLPTASEACFSLAHHLECVDHRVAAITTGRPDVVSNELSECWRRAAPIVRRAAASRKLDWEAALEQAERRISPSDFGFHNAILGPDQRLRFIDFEYAGWDDPAKTACDFLCQVQVPVPSELAHKFLEPLIADDSAPQARADRIAVLLPVYRLKWCCIVLGRILPATSARREFSGDESTNLDGAIETARGLLTRAREELGQLSKGPK
jgi:hypothetical protein